MLHDKNRILQPILREVALARQLAVSRVLLEWGRDLSDQTRAQSAFAELESFRHNFQDNSYFVAWLKNGHYYYNNPKNEFEGSELRYVLNPQNGKDAWFYHQIGQSRALQLSVDRDATLGISKLWINVLLRDGNEILGVAGTGLDLATFLRDVVEPGVAGVSSIFVDHAGVIQLHRNQSLIDFASLSQREHERNSLDLLFARQEDLEKIKAAMRALEGGQHKVVTHFVDIGGQRYLAGIVHVPELSWHQVTLLNLDVMLPLSQFSGLLLIYGLSLAGMLLAFNLALSRLVIRPLARLATAVDQLAAGKALPAGLMRGDVSGEFERLMQHFSSMAAAVLESRRNLEAKVQERTLALDRLTKIDPLCELFNRRGMSERLLAELDRVAREGGSLGILWLDIDHFKEINDQHGHAHGDLVLRKVAALIQQTLRSYDVAARWGGDEFLVLVSPTDQDNLDRLGERLRVVIAACQTVLAEDGRPIALSVSVGGQLAPPGMGLDELLQAGDEALYAAKAAGRNAYRTRAMTQKA